MCTHRERWRNIHSYRKQQTLHLRKPVRFRLLPSNFVHRRTVFLKISAKTESNNKTTQQSIQTQVTNCGTFPHHVPFGTSVGRQCGSQHRGVDCAHVCIILRTARQTSFSLYNSLGGIHNQLSSLTWLDSKKSHHTLFLTPLEDGQILPSTTNL